jgi:hypothetical protein
MTKRVGRYYILIMKYLLGMLLVVSDDITGIQSVEYSYRTTNQIQNDDTLYIFKECLRNDKLDTSLRFFILFF